MMTEPRATPLVLCYHRKEDLFSARFVSTNPEVLRLIPQLSSTGGVLVGPLTAEELREHFEVPNHLVEIAQANPGQWYEIATGQYHETDLYAQLRLADEAA